MDLQTLCFSCTQALMAGQNITLSLPKGYKWPHKFPRGELLSVGTDGARNVSFDPLRVLAPALKDQGLCRIVRALAQRGYVSKWATVGASDVGLRHARKRLWFVAAHADRQGLEGHTRNDGRSQGRQDKKRPPADAPVFACPFCGYHMANNDAFGCPNCLGEGLDGDDQGPEVQPRIAGMDHGVAHRMDRLVAIGNGQVPAVAAKAWRMLTT